jgi:glutathione S-transferase
MPIDLYHHPVSAPSHAVRLTAAALSVDLNLKLVDLFAGEQMKPEYIKMNPQHTVPVLDDNQFYISESRAALQYLANAYGTPQTESLYPKDAKKRAVVDQRLLFDMGTLYKAFADAYYPKIFYKQAIDDEKVKKLDEALGYLNGFLEKTKYFAGDNMTIADFTLVASLTKIEAVNHDLKKYPATAAYLAKAKKDMKNFEECCGQGTSVFHGIAKDALGF